MFLALRGSTSDRMGGEQGRLGPLAPMTEQAALPPPHDALDELVSELLGCGAVLSQIIGHMIRCDAAGKAAPDAAPIPTIAHSLIRDVLIDVARGRPRRDVKVAAAIIRDATESIAENILLVPLGEMEGRGGGAPPGGEDE